MDWIDDLAPRTLVAVERFSIVLSSAAPTEYQMSPVMSQCLMSPEITFSNAFEQMVAVSLNH